ncbi:MAG: hypothetical protein QNJ51_16080 [Calothrix sp. MO_167.B12]|nr:hypothetical protein [Calothrix sp. MO_167.B12]
MFPHEWEYFLALEEDLEKCTRFVEFSTHNYKTYSIEFARILLASSSEFDVVVKQICKLINPSKNPSNIRDYQECIINKYPQFADIEIKIPRYNLLFQPWLDWHTPKTSPKWWKAYNNVKHERNNHFTDANLKNTLFSVAGLMCGLLYLFQLQNGGTPPNLARSPQLFQPKWNDSDWLQASISWSYNLP